MPWYSTGTVSVVLNSDTVTGSGTAFSANARAGDAFRGPDGRWYEIGNVSSATVLTIKPAYQGATANGQAYSITPVQGYSKALADQLRDLNNLWGSTLAAVKPWATAATGPAALDDMGFGVTGKALAVSATPVAARSALGVPAVGDYGIGLTAGSSNTLSDANVVIPNGIYRVASTTAGTMLGSYIGQMLHAEQQGGYGVQLVMAAQTPPQMRMRVKNAGAWQAPVDILTSNDAANMPLVNLMPDSGRYAGTVNPLAITLAQPWANSTFSSGWNGASFMDGGKFTHDNSSNGGGGAELNARIQSLLQTMGRSAGGARYGVEFHVAVMTAGIGRANESVGLDGGRRFLAMTNNSRALFCSNQWATVVMWVRVESGSMHIATPAQTTVAVWINGAAKSPGHVLTPAEGWVHVRVATRAWGGYDNAFPYFHTVPGSAVAMACPAWFGGLADVGIHTAPIATINGASAA